MKHIVTPTCFTLVFFGLTSSATAQFAGDVFFADPSVSAATGESVTMEIQVFTGSKVAGGLHFELEYDPDQLTLARIEPGKAAEFQNLLVSYLTTGRLAVVAVNDQSLTEPFGTVSVAEVTVEVKAAAGVTAAINITAKSFVDENSEASTTTGFAASITVTSGSPASKPKIREAPVRQDDSAEAKELALKLRRHGHRVTLMVGRWVGSEYIAEPVEVKTTDPNAPSD